MKRAMTKTESQIIDDLKILFESSRNRIGIGDDAAMIEGNILISTDTMVEGVHFLRQKSTWDDIAYKLFVSNASDIAAMGGIVIGYTLSLSLPEYWTDEDLKMFLSGIRQFLKDFPADLLGGDTVRSKEFCASVTVLGRTRDKAWLRSTAQEGDFIYCTGTLGDSRLWLQTILNQQRLPVRDKAYFTQRHFRPTPRLELVPHLQGFDPTAVMDISDGLIEDLQKLCKASRKSFYIDKNMIPLSEQKIGVDNIQEHKPFYQKEALIGGEDYELLFTTPNILREDLVLNGIKITRIGRILSEKDESFILDNGKRVSPSIFKGYEH